MRKCRKQKTRGARHRRQVRKKARMLEKAMGVIYSSGLPTSIMEHIEKADRVIRAAFSIPGFLMGVSDGGQRHR
jgi:hypothetical protein